MPLRPPTPTPYHGILLSWPAGGFYQALSVLLASLMIFLLPGVPSYLDFLLYLANSYTSFRPRPSITYPVRVLQACSLDSVTPLLHLCPAVLSEHLVHFPISLLKSHHTILEVSTDVSVSRWHLPLEGRSQVSFIWVLSASTTVSACRRHSLHVYWSKQNGDKEGERIPTISSCVFVPLVIPFQGFWALITHLWLVSLSKGAWELLFKRALGRIFRELFQTQMSWDR